MHSKFALAFTMFSLATAECSYGQCAIETLTLEAGDGATGDYFGDAVAESNGIILTGAIGDDPQGNFTGSAYLFDTATGAQLHKLLPSDSYTGHNFGHDVALDGSLAVIGAPGDDDLGNFAGAVYLFDTATGVQVMKLHASAGEAGDRFGFSVAAEGGLIVAGAPEVDNGPFSQGAVYVFDAATGAELQRLVTHQAGPTGRFGSSVAISGSLIAVGAPGDRTNGYNAGAVYVFDATSGAFLTKLIAIDGRSGDLLGSSVDIDGTTVVTGAPANIGPTNSVGSAYSFDATTGMQLVEFLPGDGTAYDNFGYSVGISGTLVLVGAVRDYDLGPESGSAYLFDAISGAKTGKIYASNAQTGDFFGSVALEGTTAIIGAHSGGTPDESGALYVFDLGPTGTTYCQANANSTGFPARIVACGSSSLNDNNMAITAQPVPPGFALFFYGMGQAQVPFGDGFLCTTGSISRLNPPAVTADNIASRALDLPMDGLLQAGTVYFQCWFRDAAAGGAGFNLSDGLAITFTP